MRPWSPPDRPCIFYPSWCLFLFSREEEINRIAAAISIINYPKDTVLFVQGPVQSRASVHHQKGAAERYFEENDEKTLSGILGEGDMYGGISMLMNKGIAIRTLRITEDSYFYILPKENLFGYLQTP